MLKSSIRWFALAACLATAALTARAAATGPNQDFGVFIADQLRAHSEQLFGFRHPLEESALGPFDGDSTQALQVADGLKVTLVSRITRFTHMTSDPSGPAATRGSH